MSWNIFADLHQLETFIVKAKTELESIRGEVATFKSILKELVPFIQAVTVLLPPQDAVIANTLLTTLNTLVDKIPTDNAPADGVKPENQ